MWYFKQTAKNIWNVSKNIIDNRSEIQKLIDSIANSQEQIISTDKLNKLVALTFDLDTFNEALELILKIIKVFKYDLEQAKRNLNILIAVNYLIKHGASGFVDELRSYVSVFKNYQVLQDKKTYQDQTLQKQFSYELQKIKSRAHHIQVLLSDKQKLMKQKQLAMLIKQKMKLYQTTKSSESISKSLNNDKRNQKMQKEKVYNMHQSRNNNEIKDYTNKIDGFMEKYLWKYVDRIDGRIQVISDKIIQNFDKYVLGQLPENFELEGLDQEQSNQNNNNKIKNYLNQDKDYQSFDNDDDLMKRLQQEGSININSNLLDFQQISQSQVNKQPKYQQSLI